jgi:hypothetical protein
MDGQRTPLQDFETLYIGGEPVVVRRAFIGHVLAGSRLGQIKTMRDCEGSLTTTMARIVLGTVLLGTGLMEKARG